MQDQTALLSLSHEFSCLVSSRSRTLTIVLRKCRKKDIYDNIPPFDGDASSTPLISCCPNPKPGWNASVAFNCSPLAILMRKSRTQFCKQLPTRKLKLLGSFEDLRQLGNLLITRPYMNHKFYPSKWCTQNAQLHWYIFACIQIRKWKNITCYGSTYTNTFTSSQLLHFLHKLRVSIVGKYLWVPTHTRFQQTFQILHLHNSQVENLKRLNVANERPKRSYASFQVINVSKPNLDPHLKRTHIFDMMLKVIGQPDWTLLTILSSWSTWNLYDPLTRESTLW